MDIIERAYNGFCQISDLHFDKIAIIASILIVGIFARNLFSKLTVFVIGKIVKDHKGSLRESVLEALAKPLSFLFVIGAFYLAGVVADFPNELETFYQHVLKTLMAYTFILTIHSLVDPLSLILKRNKQGGLDEGMRCFLSRVFRVIVVTLGTLFILQIWGMNVGAFLAGLGILGMAVGFAAQDTIKNFFGCIALLADKAFQVGHLIRTPDVEGVVESIGFRTTAIRQVDKALVHIPNAKLADAAIINFARRTNRRVFWTLGLTYETSGDVLERVAQRIRAFLEEHEGIETDPKKVTTVVRFEKFNDSSIDLYCSFFTKTVVWKEYVVVREECILAFKRIVEEEGSGFAYPTQSLYIECNDSGVPTQEKKA